MIPFFTADQVAAMREWATPTMTMPVTIYRSSTTEGAFGDDNVGFALVTTVLGWLYMPTPDMVRDVDTGSSIAVESYRLYLPVGTDARPSDKVVINGSEFFIQDTATENTWQVVLRCALRRRA